MSLESVERFLGGPLDCFELSAAMLESLANRHPDRTLFLIRGEEPVRELEAGAYDAVVFFQVMPPISMPSDIDQYRKVHRALRRGGLYLECNYMALCRENAVAGMSSHGDCVLEHQIASLYAAGFSEVKESWREGSTMLLWAQKD